MNVDVYIFGEFNNGYNQYPDDYTNKIFENFYSNSESIAQVCIHRDRNLMYYGYIRKLELSSYIGFCVVLNGVMLTKLTGLFLLFEKTISELVSNGQLIHFNEQGAIVTNIDKLYLNKDKIDLISEYLTTGFYKLQKAVKPLPALNNSVSNSSIKSFSIDDNLNEIINSSHTFGYTFIYKSKDFNAPKLNSVKEIIESLNNEKIELASQLNELHEKYQKTIKQKKQYRSVALLFFVVLGCLIGLLGLNNNLKLANSKITEQSASLNTQSSIIDSLEKSNQNLQYQISKRNYQIQFLKIENQNLQNQIDNLNE